VIAQQRRAEDLASLRASHDSAVLRWAATRIGLPQTGGFVMDTRTDERRAYVEALLNRLRRLYVERVQLPGDGKGFSFELLQRLCYYVTSEGYGE
jgi:hypothetical protein